MTTLSITEQANSRIFSVGQPADGIRMSLGYRHQIQDSKSAAGVPDTSGAYLLCEQTPRQDGKWNLYVGKSAEGSLTSRVSQHTDKPPEGVKNWTAVLMLHGTGKTRLQQDETSGLERVLYEYLKTKTGAHLVNTNIPSEAHLPTSTTLRLWDACSRTDSVLRILGIDVERQPSSKKQEPVAAQPAAKPAPAKRNGRNPRPKLDPDLLETGHILVPSSKARDAKVEVAADRNGERCFRVVEKDGNPVSMPLFDSLSAAGKYVTTTEEREGYWTDNCFWKNISLPQTQ